MPTDKLIEELDDLINEAGTKQKPLDLGKQMEANLAKHWKDPSGLNAEKADRHAKVKPSKLIKPGKKPPALKPDGSQATKK